MLIHDLLENSVNQFPNKNAVWYNDQWMTYAEINSLANKLANYLVKIGIKRGERVAILYENSFHYVAAYFAVLKAGGVVVALNTETKTEGLIYLLNDAGVKAIIANKQFARFLSPAIEKAPYLKHVIADQDDLSMYEKIGHSDQISLQDVFSQMDDKFDPVKSIDIDLAAIVYTSGSTGKPKGVMLSHLNLVSNMLSIVKYLELTSSDCIMTILPFFYIYGKSLLLTHFLAGGSVVIDNRFLFPNTVLETMKKTEVTGFAGVPSTFTILLNRSSVRDYAFESLRYVTQAGGAMAPVIQKEVAEVFSPAKVFIMYGATEAAPRLSYLEPEKLPEKWGSIGKAVDNVDLYIADDHGKPLPAEFEGNIVARGSNIMMGYWQDPKATNEVLKNGIYFTGDLGKMDKDGYLFVVGRSKDILKVKGYRVSAKEIEEMLLEMNEIHEVAVLGVEDPILGEAIKAFIVPREKNVLTEKMVMDFHNKRVAVYKQLKYVEICDTLPKNKAGKILKSVLKGNMKKN